MSIEEVDSMVVLRYLGYGWLILATAVVANLLARNLGVSTRYDYLAPVAETGPGPATAAPQPRGTGLPLRPLPGAPRVHRLHRGEPGMRGRRFLLRVPSGMAVPAHRAIIPVEIMIESR